MDTVVQVFPERADEYEVCQAENNHRFLALNGGLCRQDSIISFLQEERSRDNAYRKLIFLSGILCPVSGEGAFFSHLNEVSGHLA